MKTNYVCELGIGKVKIFNIKYKVFANYVWHTKAVIK